MRHNKAKKKLRMSLSENKGLAVNLLKSLFEHREVKTTRVKGEKLKRIAEQVITQAKKNDIHARRQVFKILRDKATIRNLFNSIAPAFAETKGGYTQVIKLGPRRGDGAEMVLVRIVTTQVDKL